MSGISIISGNNTTGAHFQLSESADSLVHGNGDRNLEIPLVGGGIPAPPYSALPSSEEYQESIATGRQGGGGGLMEFTPLNSAAVIPLKTTKCLSESLQGLDEGALQMPLSKSSLISSYHSLNPLESMGDLKGGGYKPVNPTYQDQSGNEDPEPPLEEGLRRQNPSSKSTMSIVSLAVSTDQSESSANAKRALVSLLSGLYALLLIILAFAFEMSLVNVSKNVKPDHYETFYIYLYSVSIGFLVFCCVLLTDHRPTLEMCLRLLPCSTCFMPKPSFAAGRAASAAGDASDGGFSTGSTVVVTSAEKCAKSQCGSTTQLIGASHAASATGSLYLRLGAIVFGTVGVVQNCLQLFSFFETRCFSTSTIITLVLFTIFLYGQVYFIFLNSKIVIHRCQIIGKFGLMHLIATNLCVWIRSLVEEEYHLSEEISESQHAIFRKHNGHNSSSSESSEEGSYEEFSKIQLPDVAQLIKCSQDAENVMTKILQDVKPFMTTCVIEYSLICAAVMLIIWMNVGNAQIGEGHRHRNHNIRVDCSSSNKGLFAGLIFLVFTMVSMVIFFVEVHSEAEGGGQKALLVFYCSDITLYTVTIIACMMAFHRFRKLRFVNMKGHSAKFIRRSTLLDDILLMVALIGQVMFCIFSIVAVVEMTTQAILHICVALVRLLQVLVQTVVILIGQRMAAASSRSQERKPGRELITFLLVVNIALWLINTFEAQKASANPLLVELYGDAPQAWTFIVHSTIPLTIFYRFHSTVCFAEIWKNAYKSK